MAYTLADLRTLVRQRADMEGSSFVSDAEVTNYINDCVKELFELLVVTYGQEYFYASVTRVTASGTPAYVMPTDAFKLLRVDVQTAEGFEPLRPWKFPATLLGVSGSTRRRPGRLPRYRWAGDDLIFEPEPTAVHTYRLHYVPRPVRLVSTSDTLGRPYDDWVEYVILGAAIKCLQKEESDASPLDAARSMLRAHIATTAPPKDIGYPQTVVDERSRWDDGGDDDGGWSAAIAAAGAAAGECELEGAKVSSEIGQLVSSGVPTDLNHDTFIAHFGTGSAIDASAGDMEIVEDGWYQIIWEVRFEGPTATSGELESVATIDGVTLGATYWVLSPGSTVVAVTHVGVAVVAISAGSEVGIQVEQSGNTAPTLAVNSVLTVIRLAAYVAGDPIG